MELDGDHFDNDLDDDDDDSQETVRMTMTMLNNHSFYKKKLFYNNLIQGGAGGEVDEDQRIGCHAGGGVRHYGDHGCFHLNI